MEELLHVVGIGAVGIVLDASEEIDAECVIIGASLQVRVADIIGRPRVHGGGGRDNEVSTEVGRVGERSRDINCGSGAQASKLAYAQTGAEKDVPRVGNFGLMR